MPVAQDVPLGRLIFPEVPVVPSELCTLTWPVVVPVVPTVVAPVKVGVAIVGLVARGTTVPEPDVDRLVPHALPVEFGMPALG